MRPVTPGYIRIPILPPKPKPVATIIEEGKPGDDSENELCNIKQFGLFHAPNYKSAVYVDFEFGKISFLNSLGLTPFFRKKTRLKYVRLSNPDR